MLYGTFSCSDGLSAPVKMSHDTCTAVYVKKRDQPQLSVDTVLLFDEFFLL